MNDKHIRRRSSKLDRKEYMLNIAAFGVTPRMNNLPSPDINGLDLQDRVRIKEIGLGPWMDEVISARSKRMQAAIADSTNTEWWTASAKFGVTLDDLKSWGRDKLTNYAFRYHHPKVSEEVAERFAAETERLARRETDADQIVARAWCHALQVVESTLPIAQETPFLLKQAENDHWDVAGSAWPV
jgi:hypothetical protein